MEISEVTSLPELNQDDFPALPQTPKNGTIQCFGTEWRNAEKEFAATCIVNACACNKKWAPVHAEEFIEQMKDNRLIPPFMYEAVVNALWTLVIDGFVGVTNYQGADYFIPTPGLAKTALAKCVLSD